jgi:predicted nucleic acid-binding protein
VIVVDANVLLALVLPDEASGHEYALRTIEHALNTETKLIAPQIIVAEVAYQLLKQGRRRHWGEARTAENAEIIEKMPVHLVNLNSRIASLVRYAWRHNVQGYDAQYIAVAENFKAPIATLDKGVKTAARAMGIGVVEP